MVTPDVTSPLTGSPGTTFKIFWAYTDISGKNLVDPSPYTAKLFDSGDTQRDPTNTANSTSNTFVPTKDTDGSVGAALGLTGTAGWYYATITADAGALLGLWGVQTTFTHENRERTMMIGFHMVEAGAEVGVSSTDRYCLKEDVVRFMARNGITIDTTTVFTSTDMDKYIVAAMDEIDIYLSYTWRQSKSMLGNDGNGILRDLLFSRYTSLTETIASFKVPIGPIKNIVKLEVFRGGIGYVDLTSDINNENRPNGVWYDPNGIEVYIGRNIPIPYTPKKAIRIKYNAGIGTGGYVTVPGDVSISCAQIAAAMYLQGGHWGRPLPNNDANYYRMLARDWKQEAFTRLDARRGISFA